MVHLAQTSQNHLRFSLLASKTGKVSCLTCLLGVTTCNICRLEGFRSLLPRFHEAERSFAPGYHPPAPTCWTSHIFRKLCSSLNPRTNVGLERKTGVRIEDIRNAAAPY